MLNKLMLQHGEAQRGYRSCYNFPVSKSLCDWRKTTMRLTVQSRKTLAVASLAVSLLGIHVPNVLGKVKSQNIVGYTTSVETDALAHGEFRYTLVAGEATIVDYTGSNPYMKVPEMIDGHPVRAVGQEIKGVSLGSTPLSQRKHLKRILIPASVTTINSGAFGGCENLEEVCLSSGVTNIGCWAFSGCINLHSISIPKSVESIGTGALLNCSSLERFAVAADSKTFKDAEGVLYSRDGTKLIQYPIGNKRIRYEIPDSVTAIGADAFDGSSFLEHFSVAAENKIYKAVDGVLLSLDGTKLIRYPVGNKRIRYEIPDSVTVICAGAFAGCLKLEDIIIPSSATRINQPAFVGCTSLSAVYFKGDASSFNCNVFSDCQHVTVYYRPGTKGWGPTFGGRPTKEWKQ